jgi:argininosuccinate lyase
MRLCRRSWLDPVKFRGLARPAVDPVLRMYRGIRQARAGGVRLALLKGERPRSVRVLEDFSQTIKSAEQRAEQELELIKDFTDTRFYSEKSWVVMLIRQGIIERGQGAELLRAIVELEREGSARDPSRPVFTPSSSFSIWSLENRLSERIGEDLAGNINIGKTLPEPHARLKARDKTLDVLDSLLGFLKCLLDVAASNLETVMPGYTHMSQAQPTTFGHYLLSVHDPLMRAAGELESAYLNTNRSTLGCGALAGSSWPLDRDLVAQLLGFGGVLENTNDCVASADFSVSTLAALANIMIAISRLTLDLQLWGMEEIGMLGVPESYSDTSSMMPQKKNYGGQLERVRLDSAKVIACLQEAAVLPKNEPFSDMLAVLRMRYPLLEALCIVEKDLVILSGFLSTVVPRKERMLELAKKGFSSAAELANLIVRTRGIPYRRAHHITGTLVRLADERGVSASQVDASLVDEASRLVTGESVGLSNEQIQVALDPRQFVAAHDVRGGVAPRETERMCRQRRRELEQAVKRQSHRRQVLQQAKARLQREVEELIGQ